MQPPIGVEWLRELESALLEEEVGIRQCEESAMALEDGENSED